MATDNKYDRQLRLWGAKGQQALGETHVILVGASAVGTETLKNLVLPGIGSFAVLDTGVVTEIDFSSNFFLPKTCLEKSKAETACTYLQELNPDVKGSFQKIEGDVMPTVPDAWKMLLDEELVKASKCMIIAADVPPLSLESLADFCYTLPNLPMMAVSSYGLIGTVRLQLPPQGMALLEPKPTNSPPDLRLVSTFPAFTQLADSIDLSKLDSQQHGHVPYPILLYKAAQAFRRANSGNLPRSFTEKQDFKNQLKSMSRDYDKELNFQEAVANAYLAYTERDLVLPDNVDQNSKLGRLCAALDVFTKQHSNGRPPLNGSIPDMTASTELYVKLQRIYKEQADQDLQVMTRIVQEEPSAQQITQDDIANFCANVYAVGHLATRSLQEEYNQAASEEMVDDWKMTLVDPYEVPVHTPFVWYLGLRACHIFCKQEGRYPGVFIGSVEDDAEACRKDSESLAFIYQQQVIPHYHLTDQTQGDLLNAVNVAQICQELTRYGNAEVHAVASVVGGVASQEAVKIITGQYIPVDNTYIYNGIVSVGGVYKF
jgi:amyloid beta precursor protein binding protein 1